MNPVLLQIAAAVGVIFIASMLMILGYKISGGKKSADPCLDSKQKKLADCGSCGQNSSCQEKPRE